jgi:hypothetical protein
MGRVQMYEGSNVPKALCTRKNPASDALTGLHHVPPSFHPSRHLSMIWEPGRDRGRPRFLHPTSVVIFVPGKFLEVLHGQLNLADQPSDSNAHLENGKP